MNEHHDGLLWRALHAEDRAAFEALERACRDADGLVAVQPPSFDALIASASFVTLSAWADGAVLAGGWAWLGGDGVTQHLRLHPAQRASGLGKDLIVRLEQAAIRLVQPPQESRLVIRDEALTTAAEALYARCGYACDFIEYWLRRDLRTALPDAPPPDSHETWTEDSIPRFVETYVEGFRDRWAGRAHDASNWAAENTEDEEFRPDMSLLALVAGSPAGFITTFIEADSGDGFVSQIAVRPEFRRRGVAAGLLVAVMAMLRGAGASRVDLHVNENNSPARALYERLGFYRVGRRGKYSRAVEPRGGEAAPRR